MVNSDFNNEKNFSEKEVANYGILELPDDGNPFIKTMKEELKTLNEELKKLELSSDNNLSRTEQKILASEENIRQEITRQIESVSIKIQNTDSNFEKQNSELDYLKRELINIVNKLDTRIEELLPVFRREIDRISSHQTSMEQLSGFKFQDLNKEIEKVHKLCLRLPTDEEIYKRLTNEQSNLATKTEILKLNLDLINNIGSTSKELNISIGNISKDIAELKGKQSSNFVTVMGGIVLTLATLFGTIITVSNTFSSNILKQVQPQVSQSAQPIPTKTP